MTGVRSRCSSRATRRAGSPWSSPSAWTTRARRRGVVRRVLPLGLDCRRARRRHPGRSCSASSVLRRLAALHDDARALRDEGLGHQVTVAGGDEVTVSGTCAGGDAHAPGGTRRARARRSSPPPATSCARRWRRCRPRLSSSRRRCSGATPRPQATAARADTALRQTHRLVGAGHRPARPQPDRRRRAPVLPGDRARRAGPGCPRDDVPPSRRGPTASVHALADSAAVAADPGHPRRQRARPRRSGRSPWRCGGMPTGRSSPSRTRAPGCPTPAATRLFDRWVRGADAQGRAGSGLGLAYRARAGRGDGRRARCGRRYSAWSCVCARALTTRRRPGRQRPGRRRGTNIAATTASIPTTTEATNAAV